MTSATNEHKVNKMMLKINAPKLVFDGKNSIISLKEKLSKHVPVHTNQCNRCREKHIKAGQKKRLRFYWREKENSSSIHYVGKIHLTHPQVYIILSKLGIEELAENSDKIQNREREKTESNRSFAKKSQLISKTEAQ